MPLASPTALNGAYDVCVVGAGPAGLACAFDLHDAGLRVLLLEAGGERPVPGEPDVRAAEIAHPAFHDPVDIVAASALGGSTHWWGGRCVPFDESDFRHWPLSYADMLPWWEKAAEFLGGRSISESAPPPAFQNLKRFDALRDECWGPELNMGRRWRTRIRAADGPVIVTGGRVVGLDYADGAIAAARVRAGGETHSVHARRVVLTPGGLGALKLLLLLQREHPQLCGTALGAGYMGHLTGSIARLKPAEPADVAAFACRPLGDGAYARRRLRPTAETIDRERLVNIAFWLENGDAANAQHGNAAASARYLATRLARFGRGDGALGPHLANVARAPWSAASGLCGAVYLLAAARLTGRHPRATTLTPAAAGEWRLDYHAEQPRHDGNRISLADARDSVGLPKLHIAFRMHDAEIDAVVRAHQALDDDLRAARAGALRFPGDRAELAARVRAAARDGYHQLGGAAMGEDAASVVDPELRVRGVDNLYVASGAVFPSSGQANPTLTIVALARRLAAHIAQDRAPSGVHAAQSDTASA